MPSQLPQISAPATTVKKTKYYARFLNRLAHFEGDVELVDVFRSAVYGGRLSLSSGGFLLEHVRPERHPRLAAREANQHNRVLAVAHLKRTVHASFIKDLYEDFAEYMTSLLAGDAVEGLIRRFDECAVQKSIVPKEDLEGMVSAVRPLRLRCKWVPRGRRTVA